MSIFDFLFARGATPEQRDKNIFLDMIDGGGRFDDDDEFKGGPLGISALLNALGVDPYGSTNAQPSSPPPRAAPVGKPARQSAPRPASPLDLVDFITANNNLGLRPSTDAELTAAFDQPIPVSPTARPFDGAGFGYTVPPPVLPINSSFNIDDNIYMTQSELNALYGSIGNEQFLAQPVSNKRGVFSTVLGEEYPASTVAATAAYLAGQGQLPAYTTNLGNPVDMNRDLDLLAPQVEAAIRESETNYFDTAVKYPEFVPFVQTNLKRGFTTEQLARMFLKIPEGNPQ